jgi:DNA mismatch endonuclease, patch repair protein
MADIVDAATRSRMMSGIRAKNTKPELALRKHLHWAGLRYRLHVSDLPGRPDIVLPKWRAVVFVHGCFWHGHACPLFRMPKTRSDWWSAKIEKNRDNDARAQVTLELAGWRTMTVWECSMRGGTAESPAQVASAVIDWLRSGLMTGEIGGWRGRGH